MLPVGVDWASSLELCRFQPLNQPHLTVDISSDLQVVVESATPVPVNISAFVDRMMQSSQISALSSVQLSPNRMCEEYSFNT